ncbi:DUF5703 domain-containing protein [Telmatobacter bradus]|uniref:DUF5703 domain-containing protein n=1 Tax=Telmatobacter bradus TaxID=474953 RepID=UPI003B437C67
MFCLQCAEASGVKLPPDPAQGAAAGMDVNWNSLGSGQQDSMPLGNGDLAANVWTEANGDIVLLLAKADAWTETGKLVKLGRIRIHTTPQLFTGQHFSQTLHLENALLELKEGDHTARIWVDANNAALHVELHSGQPVVAHASLETWRSAHTIADDSADKAGMAELASDRIPVSFAADDVRTDKADVRWFHWNKQSIYPTVLHEEHLEALANRFSDPLLHRCFGAELSGPDLKRDGDQSLATAKPAQELRFDVVAASGQCKRPEEFQSLLRVAEKGSNPENLELAWKQHEEWWKAFWERSWVRVEGTPEASKVSMGYAVQRYMMAASSRGELPVKYNGGLFTVGGVQTVMHKDATPPKSEEVERSPDFRAWGNCYWNQNNRLLYWPLLGSGDYDLLQPWFNMYLRALPLAKARTELYYHHDGASFPETMYFFGLPSLHDFGWENPGNEIESRWQRYHIQGGLEVTAQMLDYWEHTQDDVFARQKLIPFADAIVTYYGEHWPRESPEGRFRMYPAQSLETYQLNITNPTPDLAGLMSLLPRLLAVPQEFTTAAERARWEHLRQALPLLPQGRTATNGKTPPNGQGVPEGKEILLPAESYGKTSNSENPELYVAFPYRLFGVGKEHLDLALNTYASRRSPQNTCWGQDGTESAVLGLTEEARKAVLAEFTNYGDQRFQYFWRSAHDWIPDLDNGGSGMITLQEMLLQTDGKKILLLPAWPADWNADFRLHAPYNTVVEGKVKDGRLVQLKVTPSSRSKDVTVLPLHP